MSIVSQKVDARNEIGGTGFVRGANKGLVNSATGWILAPIGATPEAFTTDVNDVQGQFPVVYNTDRMPYAATGNTQYYYDSAVAGGTITTSATAISLGKGVVSEEGAYILLDIKPVTTLLYYGNLAIPQVNLNPALYRYSYGGRDYYQTQVSFVSIPIPYIAPGKRWMLEGDIHTDYVTLTIGNEHPVMFVEPTRNGTRLNQLSGLRAINQISRVHSNPTAYPGASSLYPQSEFSYDTQNVQFDLGAYIVLGVTGGDTISTTTSGSIGFVAKLFLSDN